MLLGLRPPYMACVCVLEPPGHCLLAAVADEDVSNAAVSFAGVRYMFIGKLFEHRPSYHLLGVLLFVQLGITSASWAMRNVVNLSGSDPKTPEGQSPSSTSRHKEQKAVVLEVGVRQSSISPF